MTTPIELNQKLMIKIEKKMRNIYTLKAAIRNAENELDILNSHCRNKIISLLHNKYKVSPDNCNHLYDLSTLNIIDFVKDAHSFIFETEYCNRPYLTELYTLLHKCEDRGMIDMSIPIIMSNDSDYKKICVYGHKLYQVMMDNYKQFLLQHNIDYDDATMNPHLYEYIHRIENI